MYNRSLRKTVLVLLQAVILFSFISPAISFAGGTVVIDSVFCSGFNAYKKMSVYLPQGYIPNGTATYRVVYFLHGINNNHTGYTLVYPILDSLIANNIIQPVICVKPDGSAPPYIGSFYTNSALYGPVENWIYNNLIQYVDTHYKTKADRNNRVIMGHSMGGYGSIKMAFKHPELYRAVASHSGPLDFDLGVLAIPALLAESGGVPPYTYSPANGPTSVLFFTMCGAFSPNMSNPPYFVNFILNSQGQMIDSVFQAFKNHCAARLSLNISSATDLPVYFDCGLQDELGLLYYNNGFRDTLVTRNIPHVYYTFTGTHTSQLANRIPLGLKFLDSAMNHPVGIEPYTNELPGEFKLYQNYPNPFNPSTTIKFDIPKAQNVKLSIYDILGREVSTPVNEFKQAGHYEINFDASGLSSGAYFYKLETDGFRSIKKLVIIK